MESLQKYLVSLGYPVTQIISKQELMNLKSIARIREEANVGTVTRDSFYNAMLDEYKITDPVHRRGAIEDLERSSANVELLPGVLQTLPKLKEKGWKLGIITNSSHSTPHKVSWFRRLGLDINWDVVSNSCEVGFSKPHSKIYEYALSRTGVHGDQAYFVGHTQKELDGAKVLQMTTVKFENEETDATKSDITFKRFDQLLELM